MKTIVYPPTIQWHGLFQRPQQLLRQFARDGWTVIYCDTTPVEDEPEPNIYVTHDCEAKLKELGVEQPDLLYVTWPKTHDWVERIGAKKVLYDRVDKFKEWAPWEREMTQKADYIIASAKSFGGEYVPNACDIVSNPADPQPIPDGLPLDVSHPIVGFSGAIGGWVNVNMISDVAMEFPTYVFGKGNVPFAYNLGFIPYQYLHLYYNALDVGIIPFDKSEVSMSACPIKMYEYIAAGLQVVSTDIPEARALEPLVTISDNFVDAINNLGPNDRQARYEFSLKNTWKVRYEQIKEILNG